MIVRILELIYPYRAKLHDNLFVHPICDSNIRKDSIMVQLFILYSKDDQVCVDKLVIDLNDAGYEIWKDIKNIHPDISSWVKAIHNGIQESSALILIWSASANKSEWIEREISYAIFNNIKIFVVRIDNTKMPFSLFTHQPLEAINCFKIASRLIPYLPPIIENTLSRIKSLLSSKEVSEREEAIRLAANLEMTKENCEYLINLFSGFREAVSTNITEDVRNLLEKCISIVNSKSNVFRARCPICSNISEYNKDDICKDSRTIFMRGASEFMVTCSNCGEDFIMNIECED